MRINSKNVVIKTKGEFISKYNSIFNPDFKKTMVNALTKYMFANWRGVMFGGGMYNMWINNVMNPDNLQTLITKINN